MVTTCRPDSETQCDEREVPMENDVHLRREGIGVDASSAGNFELVRNEHVGLPGDGPGSPANTGFLAADGFESNCRTGTAREALHEEVPCAPVLVQEGVCGISVTAKKPTEHPDGTIVFHGTGDVRALEHTNCSEQAAVPDEVSNFLAANVVPLREGSLQEIVTDIGKESKKPEQVFEDALQVDQEAGLTLPAKLSTSPDFVACRGSIVHELKGKLRVEKCADAVHLGSDTTSFERPSSPLCHAGLDTSVSDDHYKDGFPESHDNDMNTPALELDFGGRGDSIPEDAVSKDKGSFSQGGDVRKKDLRQAENFGSVDLGCDSTLVLPGTQVTKKDMANAIQLNPLSSVAKKSMDVSVEHFLEVDCIEGACVFSSPLSNAECDNVAKLDVNTSKGQVSVGEIPSLMVLSEQKPHASKTNASDRPQVALSNLKGHDACEAAVTSRIFHDTPTMFSGVLLKLPLKRGKEAGVEEVRWTGDHLPAPKLDEVDSDVDRTCPDNPEDGDLNWIGGDDAVLHCHSSITSDASKVAQLTIKAAIAVESAHDDRANGMDGVLSEYEQGTLGQLSFRTSSDADLCVSKEVQSDVGPNPLHFTKLSHLECGEFQGQYDKVKSLPPGFDYENSLSGGGFAMIAIPSGAAPSVDVKSGVVLGIRDVRKDVAKKVQQKKASVGEAIVQSSFDTHEVGKALTDLSRCPDTHKECEVESANSNQEGQELPEGQDQDSLDCAQGRRFRKATTTEGVSPVGFGRTGADAVRKGIANGEKNLRSKERQSKTLNQGADQSSANFATDEHNYVNCQEASNCRECQLISNFGTRDLKSTTEDNPVRNLRTTDLEMMQDPIAPVGDEKPSKLPKLGTAEDAAALQQGDGPALERKPSCDCGMPAIEKVLGSMSQNSGLRYLSCAEYGQIKQTNRKKRKQPGTKSCRFFQWVDGPKVTEEKGKVNRKRLRPGENISSGNAGTGAALKQISLSGEDATMKTSSSVDATVPQKIPELNPSSSAVDTTVHRSSTSTAREVAMAMSPSKQVSQCSSVKKKPKLPRATVCSNLVVTSPTKSSLTAASLSELVKSASNSKFVTPSSCSQPEARSKSAKVIPEKPFRKRYLDDRSNPTVDWPVSKRLAFKSLSEVVDRPVKALNRKVKVAQSLVATDETDFRPKRRKLAAIIKSEVRPVVKAKSVTSVGWRMDDISVKESGRCVSVLVTPELGVPAKGKAALAAAGSNQGGKAKGTRVNKDKVLAKKPSAVNNSGAIQQDGLPDSDPCKFGTSMTLKTSQEYTEQKKLIETRKSGEAVWVDVPLSSPVVSSKEAKDKRPHPLGEKALAHLRNSKGPMQLDSRKDQDSSQHQEKVEAGLCDASQVDIGSAEANICYAEARDEKSLQHNTDGEETKRDGRCTQRQVRSRRRRAVS